MRTKKAIIHGRHSRKRNGRNFGNKYSNKRVGTSIKKRSIKNKTVGGALLGSNCSTSYKRFVNDKCFEVALTKQLDLAISEFLVELSNYLDTPRSYPINDEDKKNLFDQEARMLYNKIRERMFPFLLGIMKMRENGQLLDLEDFDGPYNFLISTIILKHIEEEHVSSFIREEVVNIADFKRELETTGEEKGKIDECLKTSKCIKINPVIRTHILFPYLVAGYKSKLFNALNVLRLTPQTGSGRVLVGGAEAAAAAEAEAEEQAAKEQARKAAEAEKAAAAPTAAPTAEAEEQARKAAAAEKAEAEAEKAEAEAEKAAAAVAEAKKAAEAAAAEAAAAPAAETVINQLEKAADKYFIIRRLLNIAGINNEKYTSLLDLILIKLNYQNDIMTPYLLNQELPFYGGGDNDLSVFVICNQIFPIFIELDNQDDSSPLDSLDPKELTHLEHLLCTGEMEETHTEFDLPSKFYSVSSDMYEPEERGTNTEPFNEPKNFGWREATFDKFMALVFLTKRRDLKVSVLPKSFPFYKRKSEVTTDSKDIDKYIQGGQYFGNIIPSLKKSSFFKKKPHLSMTSRIYVVNALSKLLYLMLDESEYYKHYEIFAKNITSLVDLYRAYHDKSKDCKEIKIVVEQTPSERLETEEIKPSQELSQQLKQILESLDGNKAANAQMIYELIAALKLSELHENEEINDNVGAEEAAATKIQAAFRGYKARKQVKLLKAERAEAKKAAAATKLQALYRGRQGRKEAAARRSQEEAKKRIAEREAARRRQEERAAAAAAEREAAAKKIQAAYRGFKNREAAAEATQAEAARVAAEAERARVAEAAEAERARVAEAERAAAAEAAEKITLSADVKAKICRYYKEIYGNCSNLKSKPVYLNKGTGTNISLSSLTFGALCNTDCSEKPDGIRSFAGKNTGVEVGEAGLIFKLFNHGNVIVDVEIDVGAMSDIFTFELEENEVLKYENSEYVQTQKLVKYESGDDFDLVDN